MIQPKKQLSKTKNKPVLLSDEEIKLIEKFRQDKEQAQEKRSLEEKFKDAVFNFQSEINKHLNSARQELQKAVEVSEKYGLPFRSTIVDLGGEVSRLYVPDNKKWLNIDEDFLVDNFQSLYYDMKGDFYGWEYWSVSSLQCP